MPEAAELRLWLAAEELRLGVVGCGDAGSGFAAGEEEARRGVQRTHCSFASESTTYAFRPPEGRFS